MFNEKHVREFTELKAEMFNKTFKSRVGAKFEVLGAFTQKSSCLCFYFMGEQCRQSVKGTFLPWRDLQ